VRILTMPLALAATAALTLAGCSDSVGAGSAAGTSGPGGSASPESSTSPTPITSPASSAMPTNTEDPVESQIAADCPAGRWRMDNDSWASLLRANVPSDGSLDSVTGDMFLSLGADGSYSSVYEDWTITLSVEGGKSVISRNGTDTGTWQDSDGRAVLTSQTRNSVVTGYVESPQGRFDLPTTDTVNTDVGQSFSYSCDSSTMTATTDEGSFTFTWAP